MYIILNDNINLFLVKKCLEECLYVYFFCLYGDLVYMYEVYLVLFY